LYPTPEFVRCRPISIGGPAAVLGIMLPVAACYLISCVDIAPLEIGCVDIPPVNVVVGGSVVVVVVVDIHVAVTPSTVIPPTSSPSCSQGHSDPEGEGAPGNVPRVVKRWIRIDWGTKHYCRVVGRNINHLRVGLLDHNHLLTVVEVLRLNYLLGAGV